MGHVDKILLWHLLGPVSVATFSIAQIATRYAGGMASNVSSLALPKIAQRELSALSETLPRKVFIFSAAMALVAAVYIALVPLLFKLIFPEYLDAIPLAQLLGLGFIFYPRTVLGQAITAHASINTQYIVTILTISIKIITLLFGIYLYDIWGAVYAVLLTEMISYLIGLMFLYRARMITKF
jgi:O-antigen/teichoic acid export membrane protein